MTAMELVRVALEEHDCRPTGTGDQLAARCPAHDDGSPSLSLTSRDGRALLYCHAGCTTADVLAALNLTFPDLYDAPLPPGARGAVREHPYRSVDRRLVGVEQRFEPRKFRPLTHNGSGWQQKASDELKTTPYRLPELLPAVARGETVWVTEGERDADTLAARGITATCNWGGAGKWTQAHAKYLAGANVVIVRDNDDAGRSHGNKVLLTLTDVATSVQLFDVAEGCKDVTDHLAAGHSLENLRKVEVSTSDAATNEPALRRLRRRSLREVRIVQTRYLWRDYLPVAELAFLVGKPGIGKSTLAVDTAAKLTIGQLDGDFKGEPRHVLYSITEDSESTFKARFIAAGGDVDYLHLLDVVHGDANDGVPLLVNFDLDALRDEIELWSPALFILDALNSSLAGQLNDNSNVRPQLEKLKSLAHYTSTSILGVGHFKKATTGIDPVDAIGGAGAYGQVVRHALACAADDDEGTVTMSLIKSNVRSVDTAPSLSYRIKDVTVESDDGGSTNVGWITWLGETSTSVRELLQRSPQGDGEDRADAAEWLKDYLAGKGGEAAAPDIFKDGDRAGFTKDVLKRAKGKANAHSQKSDFGGGWVWRIEPAEPQEDESHEHEGSTKGAKGAGHATPLPSLPSVLPSAAGQVSAQPACRTCGQRLLTPISQQRGWCERDRCKLANRAAS